MIASSSQLHGRHIGEKTKVMVHFFHGGMAAKVAAGGAEIAKKQVMSLKHVQAT